MEGSARNDMCLLLWHTAHGMFDLLYAGIHETGRPQGNMATARVATTIPRLLPVFVYSSGDPCGRHAPHERLSIPRLLPVFVYSSGDPCGRHAPHERLSKSPGSPRLLLLQIAHYLLKVGVTGGQLISFAYQVL